MPQTASRDAQQVAENLRLQVSQSITTPRTVTISVGIASFETNEAAQLPSSTDDVMSDLLKRADEALYRAKRTGRNRVETWSNSVDEMTAH